jgi:hypothetical protein
MRRGKITFLIAQTTFLISAQSSRKTKEAKKKQEDDEFAALLQRQRQLQEAEAAAATEAAAVPPEELEPVPSVPEPEVEQEVEEEEEPPRPKLGRRKGILDGEEDDDDDEEEEEEEDEDDEGGDEEGDEDEGNGNVAVQATAPQAESSLVVSAEEREYRMSLADKIMQRILENIDEAYVLHKTHPRNKHDGNFFIPLMFSEDIAFNSFKNAFNDLLHQQAREKQEQEQAKKKKLVKGSAMDESVIEEDQGQEGVDMEEEDVDDVDDGQSPLDPFQDIKYAVKKYRRRAEKQRKALFKTETFEVPTKDWMPVFRKGYADWQAFFTNEKRKREIIEEIIQQIEEDDEFKLEKPQGLVVPGSAAYGGLLGLQEESDEEGGAGIGIDGSVSSEGGSVFDQIPPTLLQAIPQDYHRDILPLPYGKVMKKQIVFPNEIKFYQIEVTDANVVLTIELKCRKGLASGFLNYEKLPTTVKYLYKISCTKQNNRFARLSIIPEKGAGKYFFAVYSFDAGAEYDLWAYASGDKDSEFHVNPTMERVNRMMMKWNMILNKPMEELQTHFPRIEAEATVAAEKALKEQQKTVKNKHAVLNEMRQLMKHNNLDKVLDAPSVQLQAFRENKRRKKESAALDNVKQGVLTDPTENNEEDENKLGDDELEFLEEMDNIEDFVVKVGRFAMKRSREILLASSKNGAGDDASSMNSESNQQRPPSGAKGDKKKKHSPAKSVDTESVDSRSVSTAHSSQIAAVDLIRPVPNAKARRASVDFDEDDSFTRSRANSLTSTSVKDKPSSRGNTQGMSRTKARKSQLLLDEIENPNQHADLFSTPTSTKIAAMNMIRPLQSNTNKKSPGPGQHNQDFFGEELLPDNKTGADHNQGSKHHSHHHTRRLDTVEEIKRVFDEENEKRREMDRTMATLPHLPGFSLKLAPSILEKQNRYEGARESQFIGDHSLMSSTSSALVKLPPIHDNHNNHRPSPHSPHRNGQTTSIASADTSELLNRGEYIAELLSDRSVSSGVVEKEIADITAKKRPKVHNPLLMSNPKPISYNLKKHGNSRFF